MCKTMLFMCFSSPGGQLGVWKSGNGSETLFRAFLPTADGHEAHSDHGLVRGSGCQRALSWVPAHPGPGGAEQAANRGSAELLCRGPSSVLGRVLPSPGANPAWKQVSFENEAVYLCWCPQLLFGWCHWRGKQTRQLCLGEFGLHFG